MKATLENFFIDFIKNKSATTQMKSFDNLYAEDLDTSSIKTDSKGVYEDDHYEQSASNGVTQFLQEFEEEEIENLKTRAIKNEPLGYLTNKMYSRLLQALRDEREFCKYSGMFTASIRADKAYTRILREYEDQRKQVVQKKLIEDNLIKIEQAESDLKNTREIFKKLRQNLIYRLEDKVEKLERKHLCQIQKYHDDWASPSKRRKYTKTSQEVRDLRAQSVKYVTAKRYDEFQMLEKRIKMLEAREQAAQQRALEADFNLGLKNIQDAQIEEVNAFKRANELEIAKLDADEQKACAVIETRIHNLKNAESTVRDIDKVWAKKKINYKPTLSLVKSPKLSQRAYIPINYTLNVSVPKTSSSARRKPDYNYI